MKKLLLFCFLFTFTFGADAQTLTQSDAEIIFSIFKSEKREIVRDYLDIPKEKEAKFWKMYDDYEIKRTKLTKRRIAMLNKYVEKHKDLNDADAKPLTKEFFAIRKSYLKLNKKYFKKMSKIIGASKATDFMHMEEYIEMIVRSEVLDVIPFVGEE